MINSIIARNSLGSVLESKILGREFTISLKDNKSILESKIIKHSTKERKHVKKNK